MAYLERHPMGFARKKLEIPESALYHESPNDLKVALHHVLFGIEKAWRIEQSDLASILHRSPSTISEWKGKGAVSVSTGKPSPNDAQIYELIELYDAVTSLFVRVEDQISWLHTKSLDFGGKSPLQLLKEHSQNLFALRAWVEHLARP